MPHLVLAGAGHAHLATLAALPEIIRSGHRVTVVSPEPEPAYTGMGPGVLGGRYRPEQTLLPVEQLTQAGGGEFRRDRVAAIDAVRRCLSLASGDELPFDMLSCNLGSEVPLPPGLAPGARMVPAKPVANLAQARRELLARSGRDPLQLAVVGGGPAGVEVAGNLAALLAQSGRSGRVTLVAGSRLLAAFPARARQLVLANFARRGIVVREGVHLTGGAAGGLRFDDGTGLAADAVFLALGIRPPALLAASGLPVGSDGGLLVDATLQAVGHPGIFGAGDCIAFAPRPLPKVGVHAVREAQVLRGNLLAALAGRPLVRYRPQRHCLLIFNLGDGSAVLHRAGYVAAGRWAMRYKEWLDLGFVRRWQRKG
jgi:NADH dehydrogenase FAD-containing subunit